MKTSRVSSVLGGVALGAYENTATVAVRVLAT